MSCMRVNGIMENFWQEVHQFDQHITLIINSLHSGFTDPIMKTLSNIPVWIPMYVAIVAFLFIRLGWKKALIVTISIALTFGFCDQFSNLIKNTVERIRPLHDSFMISNGIHVLEGGGGFSFFSAHAANTFGLAVCSYIGFRNDKRLRYRGYAAWIFFWAAVVSISRIFVGRHYLGDVIVGVIVGSLAGLAFGYLARYCIDRFIIRRTVRQDL